MTSTSSDGSAGSATRSYTARIMLLGITLPIGLTITPVDTETDTRATCPHDREYLNEVARLPGHHPVPGDLGTIPL